MLHWFLSFVILFVHIAPTYASDASSENLTFSDAEEGSLDEREWKRAAHESKHVKVFILGHKIALSKEGDTEDPLPNLDEDELFALEQIKAKNPELYDQWIEIRKMQPSRFRSHWNFWRKETAEELKRAKLNKLRKSLRDYYLSKDIDLKNIRLVPFPLREIYFSLLTEETLNEDLYRNLKKGWWARKMRIPYLVTGGGLIFIAPALGYFWGLFTTLYTDPNSGQPIDPVTGAEVDAGFGAAETLCTCLGVLLQLIAFNAGLQLNQGKEDAESESVRLMSIPIGILALNLSEDPKVRELGEMVSEMILLSLTPKMAKKLSPYLKASSNSPEALRKFFHDIEFAAKLPGKIEKLKVPSKTGPNPDASNHQLLQTAMRDFHEILEVSSLPTRDQLRNLYTSLQHHLKLAPASSSTSEQLALLEKRDLLRKLTYSVDGGVPDMVDKHLEGFGANNNQTLEHDLNKLKVYDDTNDAGKVVFNFSRIAFGVAFKGLDLDHLDKNDQKWIEEIKKKYSKKYEEWLSLRETTDQENSLSQVMKSLRKIFTKEKVSLEKTSTYSPPVRALLLSLFMEEIMDKSDLFAKIKQGDVSHKRLEIYTFFAVLFSMSNILPGETLAFLASASNPIGWDALTSAIWQFNAWLVEVPFLVVATYIFEWLASDSGRLMFNAETSTESMVEKLNELLVHFLVPILGGTSVAKEFGSMLAKMGLHTLEKGAPRLQKTLKLKKCPDDLTLFIEQLESVLKLSEGVNLSTMDNCSTLPPNKENLFFALDKIKKLIESYRGSLQNLNDLKNAFDLLSSLVDQLPESKSGPWQLELLKWLEEKDPDGELTHMAWPYLQGLGEAMNNHETQMRFKQLMGPHYRPANLRPSVKKPLLSRVKDCCSSYVPERFDWVVNTDHSLKTQSDILQFVRDLKIDGLEEEIVPHISKMIKVSQKLEGPHRRFLITKIFDYLFMGGPRKMAKAIEAVSELAKEMKDAVGTDVTSPFTRLIYLQLTTNGLQGKYFSDSVFEIRRNHEHFLREAIILTLGLNALQVATAYGLDFVAFLSKDILATALTYAAAYISGAGMLAVAGLLAGYKAGKGADAVGESAQGVEKFYNNNADLLDFLSVLIFSQEKIKRNFALVTLRAMISGNKKSALYKDDNHYNKRALLLHRLELMHLIAELINSEWGNDWPSEKDLPSELKKLLTRKHFEQTFDIEDGSRVWGYYDGNPETKRLILRAANSQAIGRAAEQRDALQRFDRWVKNLKDKEGHPLPEGLR